ncbi:50S ribosomal protein L18e [Candidatus Woesearchaeota archaeon CG10_big_fil_rev_8_21_14_0_10_44_13]|nr:MAG: 50S ribosomal protein L18e [Candidatus Woesearchaeota archaeon CG10_big_fil_rev_8_21_14_0_10_44_13]
MKRTGPTNIQMEGLINLLKKISIEQKSGVWKRIAEDLEKPTRKRREVNLYRIDRFTKDNEAVIVPGKVLGTGALNHKVVIAAWSFSDSAVKKINGAKGSCMSIADMLQKNPKGKNLRIIG